MRSHRGAVSRRQFGRLSAVAAVAMSWPAFPEPAVVSAQAPTDETLRSEFLLDLQLDIGNAQTLGPRRIVPVTGGTFEGPNLRGTALPGGGDWLIARPDGASELNVRATLRTDDEQLIYLWYRGILYTPPQGQGVLYWRTTPVFETASPKYDWLNRIIAVGVGRRVPGKAAYRIYQIL